MPAGEELRVSEYYAGGRMWTGCRRGEQRFCAGLISSRDLEVNQGNTYIDSVGLSLQSRPEMFLRVVIAAKLPFEKGEPVQDIHVVWTFPKQVREPGLRGLHNVFP